jgi:hypothetical protein
MPPTVLPQNLKDWPTIKQAAQELKASVRTIWRHSKRGALEIRKRPVPSRKPINVCNPSDIDKLKPAPYIITQEAGDGSGGVEMMLPISKVSDALERIVSIFHERQNAVTVARPIERIWLTLEEARSYSGRSRSCLLRMCREGKLVAEKDGGWKIRRVSLEEFEG